MKNLKENLDLAGINFALTLIIALFLSLFLQLPIIFNALQYKKELAPISKLSDQELDDICLGEYCDYTHKITFDNHIIKISDKGFQFSEKVWVFYKIIRERKVYIDRSNFFYGYFLFDLLAAVYLSAFYFYLKKERAKENPTSSKKINRFLKKKAIKQATENPDTDDSPLPAFGSVYFFGFVQFGICFASAYLFAKQFPGSEIVFVGAIITPFLTGAIFYYGFKRRLGFILSTFLCLAPAATGRDILYIENLRNPNVRPFKEHVYTLEPGSLNRKFTGGFVSVHSSGSKSRSKSYDYNFVAPYQTISEPKSYTHWLKIQQEWMEDETKFQLFWDAWQEKRLAIQIYKEDEMNAITNAGERYNLNLKDGVALLKPILSIDEEVEAKFWSLFWFDGTALMLWTIIGGTRIYLGMKKLD